MAVTAIPNVTNWTVTPVNGQAGYFTLMNTWLSQSTSVIASLQTAITAQNTANSEINELATQTENNATVATSLANYQGAWSSATPYSKGQSVSSGTLYYISKADSNLNHIVTDTNYWLPNPINDKLDKNISSYTDKAIPVDADLIPLSDSDSSFGIKKLSWANIKATLKTYFDTLYLALTGNQSVGGVKTFTSSPIVPTPTIGDNSTKAATTAFVKNEIPNALNATGTAPIYANRAKAVFNGTGTVAIKSSGNISSITDNGVGIYRVNTTVALPTNYNCLVSCDRVSTTISSPIFINYYNKQSNYVDVYTTGGDRTTMIDVSDISIVLG